jgi:formate dehydrogenase subunit gamma
MGVAEARVARDRSEQRWIPRYSLFDRILHWWVALTFIYLMLSGLALGYPRTAFLYDWLGGGQTVRFLHPWIGVGFVLGAAVMLVAWLRSMLFDAVDRQWLRNVRTYARQGHVDLDVGRYNAGQKAYFWFAVVTAILLLLTGLPLWLPEMLGAGWNQSARLLHHALFLLTIGGFIIHVYMSTSMFPGTFRGMTEGTVERRWAAHHHPRWFRQQDEGTR